MILILKPFLYKKKHISQHEISLFLPENKISFYLIFTEKNPCSVEKLTAKVTNKPSPSFIMQMLELME